MPWVGHYVRFPAALVNVESAAEQCPKRWERLILGRKADTPPDLQSVELSAETPRHFGEEKVQRRPAVSDCRPSLENAKRPQNCAIRGEQSPVSLDFTVS